MLPRKFDVFYKPSNFRYNGITSCKLHCIRMNYLSRTRRHDSVNLSSMPYQFSCQLYAFYSCYTSWNCKDYLFTNKFSTLFGIDPLNMVKHCISPKPLKWAKIYKFRVHLSLVGG
ncbi:114aa long hypothetical protein [Pyrococcus horikoshii OT3]|uniref:Uncharacterized protein n=1 Tax=Pyrococcus horikoshii (strain ATCC 700860 / DSM 12428 / JCM 9974 / NBRC 100139 / OT-3) TaxID=70601 RepID=O59113_PYRHO|nr:114aa long hypothetical protein [Pyrococcus horikoshii OT3]